MKKHKILELLKRTDKWYLGGGNRLLWAPEFPLFLDYPGFWDNAMYYNFPFQPLFTWTILSDSGEEIKLKFIRRIWTPAEIVQEYKCSINNINMRVYERKSLLPVDAATSSISIENKSNKKCSIHLVCWTVQEHFQSKQGNTITNCYFEKGVICFEKTFNIPNRESLKCNCSLSVSGKVRSFNINLSEGNIQKPEWRHSPFWEKFSNGKLQNEIKLSGVTNDGIIFMALHTKALIPSKGTSEIKVGIAVNPVQTIATYNIISLMEKYNPTEICQMSWNDYFTQVPEFFCSDEFINRYYWYRWYGLKLNTIYGGELNYLYPSVAEGIGYFRAPITYSAQCHMLENRWLNEPELARGSLSMFIANQRNDGGFRGYIDVNQYRQDMFYHANWGNSLRQLEILHPSVDFLQQAYNGLKKYAEYFDRERDSESSGLYDIDNHYETGQEYMHRYIAVSPNADKDNWGDVFRLKGVDVTIYIYELKRELAYAAKRIGFPDESEKWKNDAEKIKRSVLEKMWDPAQEMFFDFNPETNLRTGVKAATCFYPYFTDIIDETHINGLKKHLLNPKEFWTPYPVPSSSLDDEYFSRTPEWKGKRMNCPWNGRVWPMTNSHIAEALATSAIRFNDGSLKRKTVEFIRKFIQMMHYDGDPKKPNCYEHYNPFSGKGSEYRGIDDYQHSWVVDLIIKYICGIRPSEYEVIIDPFPFNIKKISINGIRIRGNLLKVEIEGYTFLITVNGELYKKSIIGKPVSINI